MHKEWADKWVAALRSGEYKQGKRVLRSMEDEYCCLGVLCEITETPREAVNHEFNLGDGTVVMRVLHAYGETELKNHVVLPEDVAEKVGMRSNIGMFPEEMWTNDGPTSLTSANDDAGWDFNKIADFIEQNYEKL